MTANLLMGVSIGETQVFGVVYKEILVSFVSSKQSITCREHPLLVESQRVEAKPRPCFSLCPSSWRTSSHLVYSAGRMLQLRGPKENINSCFLLSFPSPTLFGTLKESSFISLALKFLYPLLFYIHFCPDLDCLILVFETCLDDKNSLIRTISHLLGYHMLIHCLWVSSSRNCPWLKLPGQENLATWHFVKI